MNEVVEHLRYLCNMFADGLGIDSVALRLLEWAAQDAELCRDMGMDCTLWKHRLITSIPVDYAQRNDDSENINWVINEVFATVNDTLR